MSNQPRIKPQRMWAVVSKNGAVKHAWPKRIKARFAMWPGDTVHKVRVTAWPTKRKARK